MSISSHLAKMRTSPGFKLLRELREAGIRSDMDYMDRKMKAQMKSADRLHARAVVLIGEDEVAEGVAMLKNMADGTQEKVPVAELIEKVKETLISNKERRMTAMQRTHYCGELTEQVIGETVTLKGWVQKRRDLGGLIFVDLTGPCRNRPGGINPDISKEALEIAERLRSEYVVEHYRESN